MLKFLSKHSIRYDFFMNSANFDVADWGPEIGMPKNCRYSVQNAKKMSGAWKSLMQAKWSITSTGSRRQPIWCRFVFDSFIDSIFFCYKMWLSIGYLDSGRIVFSVFRPRIAFTILLCIYISFYFFGFFYDFFFHSLFHPLKILNRISFYATQLCTVNRKKE